MLSVVCLIVTRVYCYKTTEAAGRDQHGRSALVFCIQLEAIGGVLMLVLHVRELTGSLTTRTAAFITRCRG